MVHNLILQNDISFPVIVRTISRHFPIRAFSSTVGFWALRKKEAIKGVYDSN